MAKQFSIHSQCPPIGLLAPAADAAGRTSPYKSLRNFVGKVALVCRVNQGNAANVTFTPLQATNSSGTGSKAIPAVYTYYNVNTTLSDTLVNEGLNASYASTGQTDQFVVFEFDPAELDMANGFNHIAVQTSASNAANITEAWMQGLGRYQQDAPPVSEV